MERVYVEDEIGVHVAVEAFDRAALLARDHGDLWDSGVVRSAQTAHVSYGGAALPSRAVCHWKVRVWDKDDKPSPFSTVATWEMGLLDSALNIERLHYRRLAPQAWRLLLHLFLLAEHLQLADQPMTG